MAGRNGRVTAADVARIAGVSPTTVSYVLNNVPHQKIPEETRERVHAAVSQLGYKPSAAARALRRGRSDIVMLVIPDVPLGSTMSELIELLTDELEPHGLFLVMRNERHTPLDVLCQEMTPAAVITVIHLDPADQASLEAAGIFVVNTVLTPNPQAGMLVTVPQLEVGRLQASYLASQGHRHLGFASPADPRVGAFFDLRLRGVREVCAELGFPEPMVRDVPLSDAAVTAASATAWHTATPRVTGVCAYNDDTAFALLSGMRAVGLSAPTDLAVIGLDNIPLAPFASPPLTTIDNDIPAHAAYITAVVVEGVTGKRPEQPAQPGEYRLVVRKSA